MTRISVHLPDPIADGLRAIAGTESVSATAARLLEQALFDRACLAVGAYEASTRDDPQWEEQRLTHGFA